MTNKQHSDAIKKAANGKNKVILIRCAQEPASRG
jgi:hypothetical protein